MATSAISNFLAVFNSDAAALPPAVRFIPTAFLFVHSEPLPDGMQPSELEGFAGVTLEGLSPLTLDQLAWGYLADQKSRHVLIFCAFQERLNVANISADESFYHVLPSFFAAAPADGAARWVFLWEAGHVAGIQYAAGEVIPTRVEVERLKEDTVAEAFAGRENLLKRLGAHARTEAAPGLLAQPDAIRGSGDRLNFTFLQYPSPEAEPTRVPGHAPADIAARWSSDVRGAAFRANEQKRRRATSQAGRILQVAAAALVLLVIGQSVVIGGRIIVNKKQTLITSQTPLVTFIDTRQALLKKISVFTDNQLHPFEMLGEINPFRPKEVALTKTHVFGNNQLSASCESSDPQAVSKFIDSLTNSGLVDVDINKLQIITSLRNTTFQLNLTFKVIPEAEFPIPPPKPVAPTPEELAAMEAANNPDPQPTPVDPNAQFGPGGPSQFGPGGQGQFAPNQPDPNAQSVQDTSPAPSGPVVYSSAPAPAPAPTPAPTPAPAPPPAPDAAPAQ